VAFLALGVVPLLLQIPVVVALLATGGNVSARFEDLADFDNPTPAGLAYLNIELGAAILVTFFVTWALHGLRPGWLTSIHPRMRWRFLVLCFGLAALALGVSLVVASLLPSDGMTGSELSGGLNPWTDTMRDFVLVIVLLTPLQAAGEEYLFRGYLTQACGGIFARLGAWPAQFLAVVVPALLFALAHGVGQSAPIFFDRFAFGLVAGVLVIATGGLEAGIAMHVLNNFLAFGLGLAFGDMASTLNPSGGNWWMVPATLTHTLVYLALAIVVARMTRLQRLADPAVLVAQRGRV
jgi:membrane protease YdiL (CAAX protease family)